MTEGEAVGHPTAVVPLQVAQDQEASAYDRPSHPAL
jgi:hypothetical protein